MDTDAIDMLLLLPKLACAAGKVDNPANAEFEYLHVCTRHAGACASGRAAAAAAACEL